MLIGRAPEQQRIARLLAAARVGQSGVLAFVGEAGIGKTALLDAAAEQAGGMRVLRVSGNPAETGIAFAALLQLLRPALGLLAALPRPQARALEVAFALDDGEVGDRFAIGAACLSLLSRFSDDQPVLVIIDDAHELDRPSAEAIVFAARRLLADRVAMLLASRPTTSGPVAEAGLPLHPLTGLDVAGAARLVAGDETPPLSREQVARLHCLSAGNPLALLEFARNAHTLEGASPQAPLPAPEAVLRAFTLRLEEMSERARTALVVAAVADGDLVLAASACFLLGADLAAVTEAEQAALVTLTPGRLTFRHPLVRSAVYAAAAPRLRREVHRAVAEALPEGDLERRAWNLSEATVGPDAGVAGLLEQVAERVRHRGAYADAAAAFERAALLTPGGSTVSAARLGAAGECAWLAGQPVRSSALLDMALGLGPDHGVLDRVLELKATLAARTGSLPAARAILMEAAAGAEPADPDRTVVLLADAVRISFFGADARGALEITDRLERLLGRVSTVQARSIGNLAVGVGRILAGTGGVEHLRRAVAEFLSTPRADEGVQDAVWLVVAPLFLREAGPERDLMLRAVADRRENAALGSLPFLLFHLARDDATTDRWSSAEIGYQEAILLARESGQTTDLAMCLAGLAWLEARMGREDDCRAAAAEAARICSRHGIHLGEIWSACALADLELALGRAEKAVQALEAVTALLAGLGVHDVDLSPAPELVEALLWTGERDRARAVALDFHARAAAKRQPWAMARAERALGATCPPGEADAHFQCAFELHRGTGDLYERARTELSFGRRLRREKRRTDARVHLGSALQAFEWLGAQPWADQCAVELAAGGGSVARQGSAARDVLTPQELQIAVMLGVEGRTTRQAAAALFLSPKTVEYHLRHVYTKLGVGSREELKGALTRADRVGRPGPAP
jgi:DNA-binding CsgD family transcriptional regulator/tetratricopeptide (TPR) repeat protein